MNFNEYQLKPVLTSDGRPWVQRCYVCDRSINFLKLPAYLRIKVGELVRHRKCFPGLPGKGIK